jgi:hypothetical protein
MRSGVMLLVAFNLFSYFVHGMLIVDSKVATVKSLARAAPSKRMVVRNVAHRGSDGNIVQGDCTSDPPPRSILAGFDDKIADVGDHLLGLWKTNGESDRRLCMLAHDCPP